MKLVLLIFFSLSLTLAESQSITDKDNDSTRIAQEPEFKILYNGKELSSALIKTSKFRDRQLVPLEVVLEKANKYSDDPSVSVVIEDVEVIYIINKSAYHRKSLYKGHLVFLTVYWPEDFPLNQESSILFKLKYKYFRKDQSFDSGLIVKKVSIE